MSRAVVAALLAGAVLAAPARAVSPKAVDQAIAGGVAYLRSLQQPGTGAWPHTRMGATALAGLTLLECGAARDDRAVQNAARYVRSEAILCTYTYSISLAIMFLDRLGDPADVPVIESLTVRLLAGQNDEGGWTYDCPAIPSEEVRRLSTLVRTRNELVGRRDLPAPGGADRRRELSPEIRDQLARLRRDTVHTPGYGDNSNTQLATLGLWIARRHGLPVEDALARLDTRFRTSQLASGAWPYSFEGRADPELRGRRGHARGQPTFAGAAGSGAMTAAGLLALAVAHGAASETPGKDDLGKDTAVRAGLSALAQSTSHMPYRRGPQGPIPTGFSYYYLWSVERVCAVFDLKTLGQRDWYAWGARILVLCQHPDGSWGETRPSDGVDTCFALLFLRRSNLAPDLTRSIGGKVRDPGEVTLKSGGLGGSGLAEGGKAPEPDMPDTPAAPPAARPGPAPAPAPPARPEPEKPERPAPVPVPAAEKPGSPAARLADKLVGTTGPDRADALRQLRDARGVEYTEALVSAVGRLGGSARQEARDALAARLARMKPDVLVRYLQDDESELRRAAALACAMKDLKDQVPRLIPLLRDRNDAVSRAALVALERLSGQKLGPDPAAWQSWWQTRGRD
jgi:hypothetical protein